MNFLKRILPAFFVLFLVSCSNSFTNKASIVVRMPSNDDARAICENDDLGERHISFFGVEVTQNDKLIQEMPKVLPGKEAVFSDVAEGEYTVTVTAYVTVKEEDGTQKDDPVYKGSDTKFVAAGSEPTKFIIKLAKLASENDKPEDKTDDNTEDKTDTEECLFYENPIEDTKFHTILEMEVSNNGFNLKPISDKALEEGQYYQLVTSTNTEDNYVLGTINLVTPKEGQAPEIQPLIQDIGLYAANYLFVVLNDSTKRASYLLFTKYAEELCEENEDFMLDYLDDIKMATDESSFLDFLELYNAMQISEYMPKAYQAVWEDKKLRKSDSVFGTERPYYLNELNENDLKRIDVARINFNVIFDGESETVYTTYAMGGNSVSIPGADYFYHGPDTYAIYSDKDGKNKVSGSITVSAGINNLYLIKFDEGNSSSGGNPEGGKENPTQITETETIQKYSKDELTFTCDNVDRGTVYRLRATIPLKEIIGNKYITEGDTIVFRVTATPYNEVKNPSYQLVKVADENYKDPASDYDKRNNQLQRTFNAKEKFTADFPINFIQPGKNEVTVKYDAFQLFIDSNSNASITWVDVNIEAIVYPAYEKVLYFAKGYAYDSSGNPTTELRDEVDILINNPSLQALGDLLKNYTVTTELRGEVEADVTLKTHLHGASTEGGNVDLSDYGSDEEWKMFANTENNNYFTFDISPKDNVDNGTIKLHLSTSDRSSDDPLIIENFSLEADYK